MKITSKTHCVNNRACGLVEDDHFQLIELSGGRQNRCAVSVRLAGVLGRLILQDNSKTWASGFELQSQTAFWLGLSHHSTAILTDVVFTTNLI